MWEEHDVWKDVWRAVLGALDEVGLLEWEETFLDATFVSAKKGATQSAAPRGQRDRSLLFCRRRGSSCRSSARRANEGEASLAQPTVEEVKK
jgi:hypothetical protein